MLLRSKLADFAAGKSTVVCDAIESDDDALMNKPPRATLPPPSESSDQPADRRLDSTSINR
jgi:hypothetical protein